MLTLVAISGVYYNVIVSWTLYYFGNSFLSPIPWSNCDNEWNTAACYMRRNANQSVSNVSMVTGQNTSGVYMNYSTSLLNISIEKKTSAEEFWE